jgi:hypothetical protein
VKVEVGNYWRFQESLIYAKYIRLCRYAYDTEKELPAPMIQMTKSKHAKSPVSADVALIVKQKSQLLVSVDFHSFRNMTSLWRLSAQLGYRCLFVNHLSGDGDNIVLNDLLANVLKI